MRKRSSSDFSHEFSIESSVDITEPIRKRQRLISSTCTSHDVSHDMNQYHPPSAETLRHEFEAITGNDQAIDQVGPRQSNLNELINEWNGRMNQLGIFDQNSAKNNIGFLFSNLIDADLELMRQITSLGKETLDYAMTLRNHSSKCTDIMLDKMEQLKIEKKEQLNAEQKERDQIAAPRKDIWSQTERINYLQIGRNAAIKIEVNGDKVPKQVKWAVHKIVSVDHQKQTCVLIDAESVERKRRSVFFGNIMPLPTLASVRLNHRTVFQPSDRVLAVWPGTTCFYVATVIKAPTGNYTKYSMKFDDEPGVKEIEAEFVMPFAM